MRISRGSRIGAVSALSLLLAGCGGAAKSADLSAVKDSLAAQFKLDEMMALSQDDLLDMYGIKPDDVKQYAALIARSIEKTETVCYPDLGTEAIHRFYVRDFPAVVLMDSVGGNLYETGPAQYRPADA
jgi:hypothetical protein